MHGLSRLLVASVAFLLAGSGVARAQWMACDLTTCHVALACTTEADCAPLTSPSCEPFDTGVDGMGGMTSLCRPDCGTLFTCDAMGRTPRCPVLGGDPGVCGTGVTGSMLFTAVCRFPGWGIDYCTPPGTPISASSFFQCTHRGGSATPNYLLGDCDGDSCPNYRDPHPCAFDPAAACPAEVPGDMTCIGPGSVVPRPDAGTPDAGAVLRDAGAVLRDASLMTLDGSAVAEDGGEAVLDSGAEADAATAFDSGIEEDAATPGPDAGSSGADASTSMLDGTVSFEGGGGCACRAASARRDAPAALAALGVVAFVAARRRRRSPSARRD